MRMIFCGGVIALVFGVPAVPAVSAQTTPWGDPDLQGVYSNQTPVPLERPKELGNKAVFTKEEAAEFERTGLARLLKVVAGGIPTSGELNEVWLETQKGKVGPGLRTSLVIDPPDGRIPYTPEGLKRWQSLPTVENEIAGRSAGVSRPEDRALEERCITSGGVIIPNPFYNNYRQILQAPGYMAIVSEMMHEVRVIPLDRRPPLGDGIRQWVGDSRGWWDGQTLVVETRNFNDKRLFRGATKDLHLVERFTRVDADTLRYQVTITDPATFTRPWTIENGLRRTGDKLYEVACHEGNYGLANILSGARAQEAAAAAAR
jgi:hypothetical protein